MKIKIVKNAYSIFKKISDGKAKILDYPATIEGMYQSWRERWTKEEAREIDVILDTLVARDAEHFDTSQIEMPTI